MIDRIQLELHRLNWRIGILQTIAVKAYVRAFSVLRTLSEDPQSVQLAIEQLAIDLDDIKDLGYQAFFSDPSVPEEYRALFAEEFAHVVEEIKSSVVPS